ncbi:Lymphocyte antigen 86 [Camelus dromedarius]|uniref:Lymphocyte antigen 86 n=1 Tax=Camelus dromedarius TaxID=9838 RepID=A0A5N4CT53_CAMDR|nr:Lymphocyte antigen 86 [Camelus dromedarius]
MYDPLQDFGFSADQCSKQLKPNLNIRFGIVLREDIEELFLDVALFAKGSSILKFSYPVCEVDFPKFSFCGRKKGGKVSVWWLRAKAQRDVDQSSRLRSGHPGVRVPPSPADELNLTGQHGGHNSDTRPVPRGCLPGRV